MFRRIVVFTSGAELASPDELSAAQRVGQLLGEAGLTLVCRENADGPIMVAARACVAAGGRLETVADETAGSTGLDAMVALPGGFGSLEDTLALLDRDPAARREVPLGMLDSGGYYSALVREASDPAIDRFVAESQRGRLVMAVSPVELLRRLSEYRPPETRRSAPDPFDDE